MIGIEIKIKNNPFSLAKVKTAALLFIVETRGQGSFTCSTYIIGNTKPIFYALNSNPCKNYMHINI